jgi:plastocyanin
MCSNLRQRRETLLVGGCFFDRNQIGKFLDDPLSEKSSFDFPMKATFHAESVTIGAMMMIILIMASISAPALLFMKTAIASIGEQGGSTTTTTTSTGTTDPTSPDNATQQVIVGGGNMTISINQFSPQTAEIQPGESVTFLAANGSTEVHNVIFDLSNGTIISDVGVPFTLPPGVSEEAPTDVSEELLPAPPYNLGEPIIQNTTDGTQTIVGFNKIAFYPAIVDQNGNVRYPGEEELRRQMEESMQQGMFMPANLSTSYTMDGTETVVSSGIMLDVTGLAALEGEGVQEQQQQAQTSEEGFPPPAYPMLSSFTVTFEEPGTYDFFCAFHPGMFGQVVVGTGGEGETNQTSITATTTPSTMQPLI